MVTERLTGSLKSSVILRPILNCSEIVMEKQMMTATQTMTVLGL